MARMAPIPEDRRIVTGNFKGQVFAQTFQEGL